METLTQDQRVLIVSFICCLISILSYLVGRINSSDNAYKRGVSKGIELGKMFGKLEALRDLMRGRK